MQPANLKKLSFAIAINLLLIPGLAFSGSAESSLPEASEKTQAEPPASEKLEEGLSNKQNRLKQQKRQSKIEALSQATPTPEVEEEASLGVAAETETKAIAEADAEASAEASAEADAETETEADAEADAEANGVVELELEADEAPEEPEVAESEPSAAPAPAPLAPTAPNLSASASPNSGVISPRRLVLRLNERRVYVVENNRAIANYPVGIGKAGWETPTGTFKVTQKIPDPVWKHPWNGNLVPPGPNNPLGRHWIGFWSDGKNLIGFHGTLDESLIGQAVSHGCVRMKNADVAALFAQVDEGMVVTVEP